MEEVMIEYWENNSNDGSNYSSEYYSPFLLDIDDILSIFPIKKIIPDNRIDSFNPPRNITFVEITFKDKTTKIIEVEYFYFMETIKNNIGKFRKRQKAILLCEEESDENND